MNQAILRQYGLQSLDPKSWDEGGRDQRRERAVEDRDPLGVYESVTAALEYRGIPANHESAQQYYISSPSFNPVAFLRDVHGRTSAEDLQYGLTTLSYSIQDKDAPMHEIITSNFDRLVEARRTIIQLYKEMVNTVAVNVPDSGIKKIADPVDQAARQAAATYEEIVKNRQRYEKMNSAMNLLGRNRALLQIAQTLKQLAAKGDDEGLVSEYHRVRTLLNEAKESNNTRDRNESLLRRVLQDVEAVITPYRVSAWQRLEERHTSEGSLQLISLLLRLGVKSNPITFSLRRQYTQIQDAFHRGVESRRSQTKQLLATVYHDDVAKKLSLWEATEDGLVGFFASQTAMILSFTREVRGFLEGKTQKILPTGYRNEGRAHLSFSKEVSEELAAMPYHLADDLLSFFSAVITEIAPTDMNEPRRRDQNSDVDETGSFLSGADGREMSEVLARLFPRLCGAISPLSEVYATGHDEVKSAMVAARSDCIQIICNSWKSDTRQFKNWEDWTRSQTDRDVSQLPDRFFKYQSAIFKGLQRLYFGSGSGNEFSIPPPAPAIYQLISQQFTNSLYALFGDIVKVTIGQDDELPQASPVSPTEPFGSQSSLIDHHDMDSKMILALSNMKLLRMSLVPQLLQQFEQIFGVDLERELQTVNEVLDQLDGKIFGSFVKRKARMLTDIISNGLAHRRDKWASPQPLSAVSDYVFETLLALTLMHAQVCSVSKTQLQKIMSYLFEHILSIYLEQFRAVPRYSLEGILQATLDVEFTQQTLSYYTTDAAKDTIQFIYTSLQQLRDSKFSQASFQEGLGHVKTVLQATRRATGGQYVCFRKPKSSSEGQSDKEIPRQDTQSRSRSRPR